MASPIANNGPVGDYMVQQDLIYGFNRVDQHYCDALSDADKADFRLYSIGIKLDNNSEPQNSANQRGKKRLHWSQFVQVNLEDYQDIWDGRAKPASTVPALIKAGRKEPDPRLAQQNYKLSAAIQKHYDSIPEANVAERRHFQNYAIGRTVVTDRANNDATLEAEIITNWAAQVAKDLTFYQTMGHDWHRRYMWETFPVPHTGPPDGHVCIAATPGDFPLPTANDLLKVRADRTARGDGRHWRYEKTIYRNPHHHLEPPNNHLAYQRVVHLFASVDDYGQVQDRMAVKVQGEHNLENVRAFVRAEYDVQASLQACDNVLKTRGWSFRNRDSVPPCLGYLYLDWAPHGSLHDLIESAKSRKPEKRQFPEPMLWLIFRGLAECLHMMHTGRTVAHNEPTFADRLMSNANLPRAAGWRPLTNVDIKLRNVVIGRPTPHWYPSYKTALMIDFGHTAHNKYPNKASKLQSARPVRYKGIGTQGCRPPEQFQPPPANRRNTPIDVRASIWNTGKIMYELMNQEFYNLSDPKIDIFKPSATFLGRRFRYWPELEILVRTCLAADPDARPQLNEILWASADGLRKWEQTAMRVSGPDVPPDMLWEWKKEDFALGAVVPKHWHWHVRKRPGHDDSSSEDDDGPLDTRRPSSNHESESDGEFGDESYRPGTAEQIMKRRRRHVAHPVVAPRDGGAASGPPSSRRLSSSEQSEGEFGGESYRPSTTQEVTKEIEEARRVRGGPALIAAPGVGDAVALDGRTAVDERVPGAKRKSSEDGGGRSKRSRRSW